MLQTASCMPGQAMPTTTLSAARATGIRPNIAPEVVARAAAPAAPFSTERRLTVSPGRRGFTSSLDILQLPVGELLFFDPPTAVGFFNPKRYVKALSLSTVIGIPLIE